MTMKEPNLDNVIMHRSPLGVTVRPRRRGYYSASFSERSPERRATAGYLRANRYRHTRNTVPPHPDAAANRPRRSRAFDLIELGREYDAQARNNFTREAVLFGIIAIGAVAWPLFHSLSTIAGS